MFLLSYSFITPWTCLLTHSLLNAAVGELGFTLDNHKGTKGTTRRPLCTTLPERGDKQQPPSSLHSAKRPRAPGQVVSFHVFYTLSRNTKLWMMSNLFNPEVKR